MRRAKMKKIGEQGKHNARYIFINGKQIDVGNRKGTPGMVPPHQTVQRSRKFGSALIRGF